LIGVGADEGEMAVADLVVQPDALEGAVALDGAGVSL